MGDVSTTSCLRTPRQPCPPGFGVQAGLRHSRSQHLQWFGKVCEPTHLETGQKGPWQSFKLERRQSKTTSALAAEA